jgi:hypothetical protein
VKEKILNEENQIHNFISSSGSDILLSDGSGSASQEDTVTVPQRCFQERLGFEEVSRSHVFQAGAPPESAARVIFFDIPAVCCGSMTFWCGSGSCCFCHQPSRGQQKTN